MPSDYDGQVFGLRVASLRHVKKKCLRREFLRLSGQRAELAMFIPDSWFLFVLSQG